MNRLVGRRLRAPRDEGLLENAKLLAECDRLRPESLRAGEDGAGHAAAPDPARGPGVGDDCLGLEAEVGEEPLGGGVRQEGVRPPLEDEALLLDRPDAAADGLARLRPPAAAEGGCEAGNACADHDRARHRHRPLPASVLVTRDASPRTKAGWSFRPSAAT